MTTKAEATDKVTAEKKEMTPEILMEKSKEYAQRCIYRKVGTSPGELLLSGAQKKWKSDASIIYLSDYRLVGSDTDLRSYLATANVASATVDKSLKKGYTPDRITRDDFRKKFDAEISEIEEFRKNKAAAQPKYGVSDLESIVGFAKVNGAAKKEAKAVVIRKKAEPKAKSAPKAKAVPKAKSAPKAVPKAVKAKKEAPAEVPAEAPAEAEPATPKAAPKAKAVPAAKPGKAKK